MKIFTNKNFVQKIVLSLVILILTTTVAPNYSYSVSWEDAGGSLLKEIIQLVASLGDAVMGALNGMMLGTQSFGSAMVKQDDINMEADSGSWLVTPPANANVTNVTIPENYMDNKSLFDVGEYQIPNMLYCPENIFGNKIAALDINFLNPNTYKSAVTGSKVTYNENQPAGGQDKQVSGAAVLRSSIATWYKSFRNIAIVGLLSVLIYLGIRILISTTANDKAKYKENLKDWLVALCLVFVMHFIMSGIIMITDKFTELFSTSTSTIQVVVVGGPTFYTNLTGLVRFKAQAQAWQEAVSYTIIYLALIIYTCIFTFIYFKRFLYTAFFTMISPLVALTYPIDKAGDKKAQAFNLWLKEYTMNVIIQPIHLLLYTALVSSAMDLVANNPLYALVAIAFLVPAEKFIKKMFGVEAESTSGFGSFAGGALAMSALKKLGSGDSKKGSSGNAQKENGEAGKDKVWFQDNGKTGSLNTFNSDNDGDDDDRSSDPRLIDSLEQDEESQRQEALDKYNSEGFGQNANGEYYNPWTDEYDPDYDPTKDKAYLPEKEDSDEEDSNIREQRETLQENTIEELNESGRRRFIRGAAPIAGRMAWSAAKGTARLATKTASTVAGGAIGLAAGLTTGDFSKTMTYMAGGAMAGKAVGNRLSRMPSNIKEKATGIADKVTNKVDSIQDEFREKADGYASMREQQIARNNRRAREAMSKDKNEIRKYEEMKTQLKYDGNVKDLMNAAMDYKEAGIEDEKLIKNALKVEQKNGGIGGSKHKNIVDVARFTKDYGKDYIENKEKRESLEGVVKSKVKDKRRQKEVMETFADIHGLKENYKRNSRI